MPQYTVTKPMFIGEGANAMMYKPGGKRSILTVDKPYKVCPDGLVPIQEESAAARKKREATQAKQAKADAEKAEQDKKDIAAVTFTQPPSESQTVTL